MKRIRNSVACAIVLCLLALGGAVAARAQENRRVRIINRASASIYHLYASNVDSDSWEEDMLGLFGIILPDHYVDANIEDGTGHCHFDLKAVLSDGRVAERRNVNVCTATSWTITDK